MVIPTKAEYIMIGDPWDECIRNTSPVGLTLIIMILFSVTVQMAEGLHYGVVPYISRPALGIVSGMIGAGGNLGAVVSGLAIMPATMAIDEGFIQLGIVIMTVSCIMHFIYFPEHGCMLLPAGALGSYDPQLIKPDAGQVGSDQLNFDNVKSVEKGKAAEANVTVTSSA